MKNVFNGVATALITPFTEDGNINYEMLELLIERQIKSKINALVIAGTTGEGSTLNDEEFCQLISASSEIIRERVPLIAGAGSNCTETAVKRSRAAEKCGANALLSVTPYYNKTTEKGAEYHFNAIADQVSIPVILYNVPSRTGFDLSVDVCQALSSHPRIVGIKEASGNLSKMAEIRVHCPQLSLYSGNDEQFIPCLSLGGYGLISVVSNLIPDFIVQLYQNWENKDLEKTEQMQLELIPLIKALFCEVNPIPVKYAMKRIGFPVGAPRMPLIECSALAQEKVNYALKRFGMFS